ncbi:20S proteasome subunit alpha-3 [Dictyostelium discoideum AX4]|uniref:Proteasome subunit alpha type-3 n=1 Tax=Dictyostelium discoideum TaxID=44689 RepID=PSA3_DICDI|nr:20S proteasome subunit alpha-3 [Dictyostelium discoideum AX4]Q27563.2 RecName: Full=Proteasome subunit alpha type-3 [Dictyostelium discoideum]EAL73156.1 20S proteasome subunit alpha-3 [Dictyostelium discoideum AX4]|eukprot:XP_647103.1 20S proteasome subunit alpha-3 [Dictyostelium discoideum AX4]
MSSVGSGYDLYVSTYSPDGKLFQVDYANKAVENSGTLVAIKAKDGVVLGVEKLVPSKMLCSGSNRRVHHIDTHVGVAIAGFLADARQLITRARSEAKNYKSTYGQPIPIKVLSQRIASYNHMHTLYGSVRPFGCSIAITGIDQYGPQLFLVEPSGSCVGYFGASLGKGKQAAKNELEKIKFSEMTCREAIKEVSRIIYSVHDEVKDKDFELELGWISTETNNVHQIVPKELHDEAEAYAKQSLEDANM